MTERKGALKETPKREYVLRDFKGVNTQPYRTSIADSEWSWLENVMPLGYGNMKAVPAQSAILATLTGETCYYMASANISGTDYMYMFCASGAAYQVNLFNYVVTKFANAGIFSNSGVQIEQWKNERILIIDPSKGTWTWDAITLSTLNNTVFSITVTNFGSGYTGRPTVNINPVSGGAGAAATPIVGLGSAVLAAAGTGYFVGDILTLTGGTATTFAQIQVTSVGASNAITGFTIKTTGDYTVTPASPVSTTGGFGTGATLTATWSVISINVTNGGSGYLAAPTISFTGGGGTNTTALATINSAPSSGTSIAVYSGRVWIANGRTIIFSAPGSYNDWTSASAGGSFIIADSTLHNNVVQLVSSNNYLYIFGEDSINVVSDVRVSGSVTIFSNTNLTSFVGSSFPLSIIPYLRGIFFANKYGCYLMYGAVPQKVSSPLDGVFGNFDLTKPVSAASVTIYNNICASFMFNYVDPSLGARSLICVYFDNKWFFASQGNSLTLINSASINGSPTLFGTDGTNLYQLFINTTSPINTKIQSKLDDFGNSIVTKQALKFGVEINVPATTGLFTLQGSIDTESGSNAYNFTGNYLTIKWINNSFNVVTWQNNALATVNWVNTGFTLMYSDVTNFGKYLGYTLTSTTPGYQMNASMMEYEERTRW